MNLEMIESMWKEDSKLHDEKLDHDSLAIPRKHAKYLQLLNQVTMLRDEHELKLKSLYRELWEFYTGKSTKPFPTKLLKTDISIYIDSDEKYQKAVFKLKYYNQMIDTLKSILTAVNNQSFMIKNAIEFAKMLKGYDCLLYTSPSPRDPE